MRRGQTRIVALDTTSTLCVVAIPGVSTYSPFFSERCALDALEGSEHPMLCSTPSLQNLTSGAVRDGNVLRIDTEGGSMRLFVIAA
jgi:hypothetical protein